MEEHKKKKVRPFKYLAAEDLAQLPACQHRTDPAASQYMFTFSVSQQSATEHRSSINPRILNEGSVSHSTAAYTDHLLAAIQQANASNLMSTIITNEEVLGWQDQAMDSSESISAPSPQSQAPLQPSGETTMGNPEDEVRQAIFTYDFKGHEEELMELFRVSISHGRFLHSLSNLGIKDPEPNEVLAEALQKSINISTIPTPYFVLLRSVWIFAANEAACELLGIPEEDMLKLTMWDLLHPDDIMQYLRDTVTSKVVPKRLPAAVYRLRTNVKPKTDSKPFSEALYKKEREKPIRWHRFLDPVHRAMHAPCSEYVTCVVDRSTVFQNHAPIFHLLGCIRVDNVSRLKTE